MIYRKDLCTIEEFKNMTLAERQNYLNKIYGDSSTHKALAVIKEFSSSKIEFEVKYFIFADNILQEFCLFKDNPYAKFATSSNNFITFCRQKKFSVGDEVICEIQAYHDDKVNLVSFKHRIEKMQVQRISETYKKIGIPYEPNNFYELRNENNNLLEVLIFGDMSEKIQKLIEEKNSQVQQLQKNICDKRAKLNFLENFGISVNSPAENFVKNISAEKNFDSFDEMTDYWQSHLNTAAHGFLKYDKRILESLYFGLQTDQLILLMGNPGTGKTSLVKALAKSFNFAPAKIIPVQSNWTDKNDLLGYYNPLEKNYMSTPFLDALIDFSRQAEKFPEKLFIICLDEMNLAHVEYYFAEFLSVLQDSENAEITLYSEQLRQDILYELQYSGFKIDGGKIFYEGTPLESLTLLERKYYFELRRLAQMLINYPAKFTIPKNVKFFGTLNQDETTLDISPKVLDRSYVIRIEKFSDAEKIPAGDETPLQYKPLENYSTQYNKMNFADLKNTLQNFKPVHISSRVTEKITDWAGMLSGNKAEDYLIASCVLPKIRLSDESYDLYAAEIEKLCADGLSKEIWQRINSPKDKQADFWRR